MPRKIPSYLQVQKFELIRAVTGATTYHLRVPKDLGAWALCTVNDSVGSLDIQSDFGNWSYLWGTNHLGHDPRTDAKLTLTQFIALRDGGHCDYLADKLTTREERDVFDADETIAHMKRELFRKRLEAGREVIEYYDDCEPDERHDVGDDAPRWATTHEVWIHGQTERWPLDKSVARGLYRDICELATHDWRDPTRFTDAYFEIEGIAIISNEPWEGILQYTPSSGYYQLLHGILPALVEACFKAAYPGRHYCKLRMGREDGAGHWRDWHRGHGCHVDPLPVPGDKPPENMGTLAGVLARGTFGEPVVDAEVSP